MPQVGFEPTIPVFERAKIVHVLDRAATVIGIRLQLVLEFIFSCYCTLCNNIKISNSVLLKFVTALHVSAYSAIFGCVEIRENCCAFRAEGTVC
jgi:hypothetical protein